jgi:hypothetical protein
MIENKYSYLVGTNRAPTSSVYQEASPEGSFENLVQSLLLEGQQQLQHREYNLALSAFREVDSLILHTAHPQMPLDPNRVFANPPATATTMSVSE